MAMKSTILLVLAAVVLGSLSTRFFCNKTSQAGLEQSAEWAIWKSKHSKTYSTPVEEVYRAKVFAQNALKIQQLNAAESTATFEANRFADLTEEEFKAYLTGFKQGKQISNGVEPTNLPDLKAVPAEWNWQLEGVVTPVKDQGRCGSCWAFSTTGNLEGLAAITTGNLYSFSEQMLMDCSFSYGNDGCDGGYPTQAVSFVIDHGIQTEADYPYVAMNMMCQPKYQAFTWTAVQSQVVVPKNNNDVLLQSAYIEPVSVGVDASNLQYYKSGIVTSKTCKSSINHAVLVVGWGADQGTNYWLVKNSWGQKWGEQGYFRVERISGVAPAACAISALASYALTTK